METSLKAQLMKRIARLQARTRGTFLPMGMRRMPGLFRSDIHFHVFNFGSAQRVLLKVRIPDNNAFVTFWTLDVLLDGRGAGGASALAGVDVEAALTSLMSFHDKTRAADMPLFMFWRQKASGADWVAYPENLVWFFKVHYAVTRLKEPLVAFFARLRHALRKPVRAHGRPHPRQNVSAFAVPADFDDSALNWSLGCTLSEAADEMPGAWRAWASHGFDWRKLAERAVSCAYRPFSEDEAVNAIDPRSFFAIREFLWKQIEQKADRPAFSLLTTWASTIEENRAGIRHHYKLPFNVNNLDCSVQANVIYAATKGSSAGMFPADVPGLPELLVDTSRFLAWALESGAMLDKPDLILLYYPCPKSACFFISRIVHLLESMSCTGVVPAPFAEVQALLVPVARKVITEHLLSTAQRNGALAYWAALDSRTLDQRKYATALCVNALFNLWSRHVERRAEWLPDVPSNVPPLAEAGVCWLRRYGAGEKYSDDNAFFSASVKSEKCLPFLFPANSIEHIEAPFLAPDPSKRQVIEGGHGVYAMRGVPSRDEYSEMIKGRPCSGNQAEDYRRCHKLRFPFWSAPSVTLALVYRALSRIERLSPATGPETPRHRARKA